jgi:hypothetical protein
MVSTAVGGAVGIAGMASMVGILFATIAKKKTVYIGTQIHRLFPGYADFKLIENTIVEKSTGGYEVESIDSMTMRLSKLYPDYNILFAAEDNELFGYKQFSKNEIEEMEEYEHCKALKDISYFNQQSYKNLSKKISDFCWSKVTEDPSMKIMAYDCLEKFKYGTQGFLFRTFVKPEGYFEGWTDMSGKLNSFGICKLKSGYEYAGNWNNNEYSGKGKLIYRDTLTGEIISQYTGYFDENHFQGKGIYQDMTITYEGEFFEDMFHGEGTLILNDGRIFNGVWKKGNFKKGSGNYGEGIYTGKWKYIKDKDKDERLLVPHGKGVMLTNTGETITGNWRKGKYIAKRQKVDNKESSK